MIEVGQTLSRKALGQLALDDHILHLVAQQLVVDVPRHRGLVHSKRLQGTLHPETHTHTHTHTNLRYNHIKSALLKPPFWKLAGKCQGKRM